MAVRYSCIRNCTSPICFMSSVSAQKLTRMFVRSSQSMGPCALQPDTIGVLILLIRCWGPLYYIIRSPQNCIGNYLGPYFNCWGPASVFSFSFANLFFTRTILKRFYKAASGYTLTVTLFLLPLKTGTLGP